MIAHGHRHESLPHYTRRQIHLYYEQALRLDDRDQGAMMQAIMGSFGKKANQIMRKLLRL